MNSRINLITSVFEKVKNIQIIRQFADDNGFVLGRIEVIESEKKLEFEVEIAPPYPLQFHESESIRFLNIDYLSCNHVNGDGSICLHTHHNPDLKTKLEWDTNSLKEWIEKYYLQNGIDEHYEHIIVNEYQENEQLFSFLFTDVVHSFTNNTFGTFKYSLLAKGKDKKKERETYLVNSFRVGNIDYSCNWSDFYKNRQFLTGIYVFIENPPVKNKRFAVDNWLELENFISQDFLKFLHDINKNKPLNKYGIKKLPLLIGYRIPNNEIHWQCALIETSNFPNEAVKLENKKGYAGQLKDMPIVWSSTKNCSYKYFFGRGKFSDKITEKKILIIGIGAVGSIVATTLTRCGCKFISLVDYDVKEPENVCRSEYDFYTGINNKVSDLGNKLSCISPFVELKYGETLTDALKYFVTNGDVPKRMKEEIEEHDFIIDCTTDDDVAYILDSLNLKSQIINLSITNNARELLCSVKPNLYNWLMERDTYIQSEKEPLYEPVGCWSPTFKASYNDINALVQFALKHINITIEQEKDLRHFYLSTEAENEFNIKLHQF